MSASGFGSTRFGAAGAVALSLGIPAAAYPGRVATSSDLIVAVDRQQTTLLLQLNPGDTSMSVVDPSRIVAYSLLSIDDEIVKSTGPASGNVVPVSRGFDGTVAGTHFPGAAVSGMVDAYHHNALAAEVAAIEQTLGPGLGNIGVGIPGVFVSSKYTFTPQSPGGNLVVGNNSITLTPVPQGVNGTNTEHWLYISGGTGTPEPVKITGGSAVSGAPSGTLIVNCANAHSGAWTIQTATAGIQEAAYSIPPSGIYTAGAGQVMISGGWNTVHAPITNPSKRLVTFAGLGPQATVVQVATDFPLSVKGVFVIRPVSGPPTYTITGAVTDLTIIFTQPDEPVFTNYIHWPPAIYTSGTWHPLFENLQIIAAWTAIKSDAGLADQGGLTIDKCQISAFFHGIDIDQSFQPTIIANTTIDPEGLTNNQITAFFNATPRPIGLYLGRIDGLAVSNFITDAAGALLHAGGAAEMDTGPNGSMVNVWFDLGQFVMVAGNITISNGNFGTGSAIPAINMLAGKLQLSNCAFGTTSAHPVIETNISSGYNVDQYPAALQISNSYFHTFGMDTNAISAAISGAYSGTFTVQLTGNVFVRASNIVYNVPTVSIGAGKIMLIANDNSWPNSPGVGSGYSFYISDDQPHAIGMNSFNGWSLRTPATLQKASIVTPAVNSSTPVASAASIVPTGPLFHVTGTVAISGISTPAGFPYTVFVIIPDAAFTLVASATVGKNSTAVIGQAITMRRDPASGVWFPSY